MFALRAGVVGIRGVKSELYLCMNQEGIAHGMVRKDTQLDGKASIVSKSCLCLHEIIVI